MGTVLFSQFIAIKRLKPSVLTVIRRDDLGFVVSRALAVWIACLAMISGSRVVNEGVFYFTDAKPSAASALIVGDITVAAAQFVLALLLWKKASAFGRQTQGLSKQDHPDAKILVESQIEKHSLRRTLFSGVGLSLCMQGIDHTLRSYTYTHAAHNAVNSQRNGWKSISIEVIVGAAVFVFFTWGGAAADRL